MNALIFDVEILRCIPDPHLNDPTLEYCNGWSDFDQMGISCVAAYDYAEGLYRLFLEDNLAEFQALVKKREHIIGFNSSSFDDLLCAANGLEVTTTYDLLREVRIASGQPPDYERGATRAGYSLNRLAQANLGVSKTASGELAPMLWQRDERGAVLDYALRDAQITKALFDKRASLIDPTDGSTLTCREPHVR